MRAIYAECFGFLVEGYRPETTTPERGVTSAPGLRVSLPSGSSPVGSEKYSPLAGLPAMPSPNLLRQIDELCIRNLTAAVARGEPLQSNLDAAIAAFEMNYGARPVLTERPAREVAA